MLSSVAVLIAVIVLGLWVLAVFVFAGEKAEVHIQATERTMSFIFLFVAAVAHLMKRKFGFDTSCEIM